MTYSAASAEVIGLKALEWLVSDDELFTMFLGSTGAVVGDVKNGAKEPVFLGSVLDFLLMNDDWIRDFCNHETLEYTTPYEARQCLPGGDIPNWT
jgi:hypothetical protein